MSIILIYPLLNIHIYLQLDSHPREDHPANVRSLVQTATEGSTTVDSAPYAFQKAPDWFHSPASHWKIQYHDDSGQGEVRYVSHFQLSICRDMATSLYRIAIISVSVE